MEEKYRIYPAKLKGQVAPPAALSLACRAIICAAWGAGASGLTIGGGLARELQIILGGVKALGALWQKDGDRLEIIGCRRSDDRQRWAAKFNARADEAGGGSEQRDGNQRGASQKDNLADKPLIPCGQYQAAFDLLLPLALVRSGGGRFTGEGAWAGLDLEPYEKAFGGQAAVFRRQADSRQDKLDIEVQVLGQLVPGRFVLPPQVSASFLSGLLLALPLLKGDSQVCLSEEPACRQELTMTLRLMAEFGCQVNRQGEREFFVPGRQRYQSRKFIIERDYGLAAYYLAAAALGQEIEVQGLPGGSLQENRVILDLLARQGKKPRQGPNGGVSFGGEQNEQTGPAVANTAAAAPIAGEIIIDCRLWPDLLPPLTLLAALTPGSTRIQGPPAKEWEKALKEPEERPLLLAIAEELNKLGARIEVQEEDLLVEGVTKLTGSATVSSQGDYRIALMLALAASLSEKPAVLEQPLAAEGSYPGFWQDYRSLGGWAEVL